MHHLGIHLDFLFFNVSRPHKLTHMLIFLWNLCEPVQILYFAIDPGADETFFHPKCQLLLLQLYLTVRSQASAWLA
jgi:hypothetical protein